MDGRKTSASGIMWSVSTMPTKVPSKRRTGKKVPDGFPLWIHPSGRWCKKVRQRVWYFGSVANDPDGTAALDKWNEVKDDLLAGRTPRPKVDGLELRELVNRFLTFKGQAVETGELRRSTFKEYHAVCGKMLAHFGKRRLATDIRGDDFASLRVVLAKGIGLAELAKRIQVVRSVFKFGFDTELLATPPRYGKGFDKPSRKVLRRERAGRPRMMLDAKQIRALIDAASGPVRCAILLAINCAFGNTDVASLPISAIDFRGGWVTFPRPKTGVSRRCPLWSETTEAIKAVLARRPVPKLEADSDILLITKYGGRWVRFRASATDPAKGAWIDSVGLEFRKVAKALDMVGAQFYTLRHVWRTVADAVNDRPAIDVIMGHLDENDMREKYVHGFDDARLRKVTDHVHGWLFEDRTEG